MSIEIKVPDIGDDKVEVTEILVQVGDKVEFEQSLLTVEGDKASMEIPSLHAGIVQEIKVAKGDKVETGSLIMIFEANSAEKTEAKVENFAQKKPIASQASSGSAQIVEVTVPDIGDDEVEVTEILVKVGETITAEQSLLTVEGDKASMEVPSPLAGTLKEVKVTLGDKVKTGSLIMLFETVDHAAPTEQRNSDPASASINQSVTQAVQVPDIGDDTVEVTEILVKVGDSVAAEQSLITVEGDKASMEVPAPIAGTVTEITVKVGDKVKTGSPMMTFSLEKVTMPAPAEQSAVAPVPAQNAVSAETKSSATVSSAKDEFSQNQAYVHATPVIRRLAREFGVNLAKVKGTGRKQRILKEDVQAYVKQAVQQVEAVPAAGSVLSGMLPWPKVDFSKFGEVEEVELGRIQKISGANLSRNWMMIPHVTHFDESDITELEAFRKQQNVEADKQKLEVKITPVVFIMKAVAKALEAFPRFNSSLSEDAQRLTLKKYINIGVAVDTPNGLVVPVFRDVNKKGITELSRELMDVSKKARAGKLTASDMQGGCFTISSLGGLGTTSFTPIVNAPEVAILGVSKSGMKPVWNGKEFEPRLMLPLSLSFDHRVIDGAEGARFVTYISQVLSDIRRLVM